MSLALLGLCSADCSVINVFNALEIFVAAVARIVLYRGVNVILTNPAREIPLPVLASHSLGVFFLIISQDVGLTPRLRLIAGHQTI
jgi:hypothetical protein